MTTETIQAGPFVIPVEAECFFCWLVDRIEHGSGPLEIGLCYALHTGAAAAGGASVPICERHQALVDRTAADFMAAMHSVEAEKAGGVQ